MKIEALTPEINANIRGKCPSEKKLRDAISETLQRAGAAALAGGDADDPVHRCAILLAMCCQMLWNALEDAKAEIKRLKKETGGAPGRGRDEGLIETERGAQENP